MCVGVPHGRERARDSERRVAGPTIVTSAASPHGHRSTRPPVVLCDVQHASDMAILQQQKKLNHTLTMLKLVRQQPL